MKILRTKQIIEIKNVRHLKFVRYILTLCFLLFIVVGITGCTKEYTADDIKRVYRGRYQIICQRNVIHKKSYCGYNPP